MSLCVSIFLSLCLSICHVTFSRPLIGQKSEGYVVEQVIKVDELNKGNISAAARKQDEKRKAELSCGTLGLKYHTQNFYLRCFKSDFDAVKGKFGLHIE